MHPHWLIYELASEQVDLYMVHHALTHRLHRRC